MKNRTTLQLPRGLLKDLKGLKNYKRETYEDVLNRLIKKKSAKKRIKEVLGGKI